MAEGDTVELYDAEGNPIEDAAEKFVPKEKVSELEAELAETRKRLAGLENKEFNFKRLREMSDAEKAKLSEREIELAQRQEALEEQTKQVTETHTQFLKQTRDEWRDDAISALVGDDEKAVERVLHHYGRLADEATTKADIRKKVRDAVRLASDDDAVNPLFRSAPNLGVESPKSSKKGYADTPEGKAFAKSLGLKIGEDAK